MICNILKDIIEMWYHKNFGWSYLKTIKVLFRNIWEIIYILYVEYMADILQANSVVQV